MTTKPRLLDLYCGAGGASKGYADAGFDVVGVDISPQPNYPYEFHRADALTFDVSGFDFIHASPPCQAFTPLRALQDDSYLDKHVDLIIPTRKLLERSGAGWVMENVPQAPLQSPIMLCGSMFDLPVRRHRNFESNVALHAPECNHSIYKKKWPDGFPVDVSKARRAAGRSNIAQIVSVYGRGGGRGDIALWQWAMGSPWMKTRHELAESIPPAYTEYIGKQLLSNG